MESIKLWARHGEAVRQAIELGELAHMETASEELTDNWLRVLGTAERSQIDQCVRHQLHTVVALLFGLKAQQTPFEFVLPRKGPLHAEP